MPRPRVYPDSSEPELIGKLAEFRSALQEEIEAARRNERSSAVQLTNGKLIGQAAGGFQYAFDIDNALNAPEDSPGDLHVGGRPQLAVTVISVVGLSVTLSVDENLGDFVPEARLKSNLTFLMRKLIQRIENLSERANPVGDRILGLNPKDG